MILDKNMQFCAGQDFTDTATAGTENCTDVLNLGDDPVDLGSGRELFLVVIVTTAFTSGGTPAITFQLVSDDTDTLPADGSETPHIVAGPFTKGQLTQGAVPICQALPAEGLPYEQYLGMQVKWASAALTAGSISAFLTLDPKKWAALPDALPALAP